MQGALLSLVSTSLFALSALAAAPYCLPGQACFPSTKAIATFNGTVGGKLFAPVPYAAVCYVDTYNAARCADLVANQTLDHYRDEIPTAAQFVNWELDDAGNGCVTPATVPPPPGITDRTCVLGAQASYVVRAETAQDVSLAVKFAAKYNLRLRVKNTGHDYSGRSLGPGSFTIWTHNMKNGSYVQQFVPDGCGKSSTAVPALVAAAGIQVEDLYNLADKYNVVSIGGFNPTPGAAGGFMLAGGTGPLAPMHGLGVDNLLQTETVKADGSILITNACQNSDLFWALRGGGGTFGVNTRIWLKAHPAFTGVNVIAGTFVADTQTHYQALVRAWIRLQPKLNAAGWGLISAWSGEGIVLVMSQPGLAGSTPLANITTAAEILNAIISMPGVTPNLQQQAFNTWNEAYTSMVAPIVVTNAPVGVPLLDGTRIMSNKFFANDAAMDAFANITFALPNGQPFLFQTIGGGAVNKVSPTATAMHPAWRDALAFFDLPVFGANGSVPAAEKAVLVNTTAAVDALFAKLGYPIGGYYGEQSVQTAAWKDLNWGSNYARLSKIKTQVDPHGVFSCAYCVNSDVLGW